MSTWPASDVRRPILRGLCRNVVVQHTRYGLEPPRRATARTVAVCVQLGGDGAKRDSCPAQTPYLRESSLFVGIGLQHLAVRNQTEAVGDVPNPFALGTFVA